MGLEAPWKWRLLEEFVSGIAGAIDAARTCLDIEKHDDYVEVIAWR